MSQLIKHDDRELKSAAALTDKAQRLYELAIEHPHGPNAGLFAEAAASLYRTAGLTAIVEQFGQQLVDFYDGHLRRAMGAGLDAAS